MPSSTDKKSSSTAETNGKVATAGVPLYASFASTSSVLNDGLTPNTLTLRIVNISGQVLTLDDTAELNLTFDYGDKDKPYALVTEGELHGFEVAVDDVKQWDVRPKPTSNSPVSWTIKPKSGAATIPVQGAIELTISSIVTSHPSGGSNLYLGYKNFGSYADGQLVVTIEKNLLLFSPDTGDDTTKIATERVYYDSAYILELDKGAIPPPPPPPPPAPPAPPASVEVEEETVNKVMEFDGSSNYIDLGNNIKITTGPFTLEAWICPKSISEYYGIVGNQSSQNCPYLYIYSSGGIAGGFFNVSWCEIMKADGGIQANEWYHVAVTFSGHSLCTYFNGVEGFSTNFPEMTLQNNEPLNRIGNFYENRVFPGKISEVRVWTVARTEEQIKSAMKQRLKGDEDGLIGYWQLNETIDGKVKDLTSNGNDGTVHGATLVEAPDLDLKPFPKPKPQPKPVAPPAPPPPPITDLAKKGQIDLISATSNGNVGFAAPAIGVLVKSEQSWYSQGVTSGQLLHSVALAPGESSRIAITGLTAVEASDRTSVTEIMDAIATDTAFDGSQMKQQIAASSRLSATLWSS